MELLLNATDRNSGDSGSTVGTIIKTNDIYDLMTISAALGQIQGSEFMQVLILQPLSGAYCSLIIAAFSLFDRNFRQLPPKILSASRSRTSTCSTAIWSSTRCRWDHRSSKDRCRCSRNYFRVHTNAFLWRVSTLKEVSVSCATLRSAFYAVRFARAIVV
jgi:hypothetical protein